MSRQLTGRCRFTTAGFFAKRVVLEVEALVEDVGPDYHDLPTVARTVWVPATPNDVMNNQIKAVCRKSGK